jgi:hypothetical protein
MNIRIQTHEARLDQLNNLLNLLDERSDIPHDIDIYYAGKTEPKIPKTKHNISIRLQPPINMKLSRWSRLRLATKQVYSATGEFMFMEDDAIPAFSWDTLFESIDKQDYRYIKLYTGDYIEPKVIKGRQMHLSKDIGIQAVWVSDEFRINVINHLFVKRHSRFGRTPMTDIFLYHLGGYLGVNMAYTNPSLVQHDDVPSSILKLENSKRKWTAHHQSKSFIDKPDRVKLMPLINNVNYMSGKKPLNPNLTFFHIPKNGGCTIRGIIVQNRWQDTNLRKLGLEQRRLVYKGLIDRDYVHVIPKDIPDELVEQIKSKPIIVNIRNPYSRAVSIYLYLIKRLDYVLSTESAGDVYSKIEFANWVVDNKMKATPRDCLRFWQKVKDDGSGNWCHPYPQVLWTRGIKEVFGKEPTYIHQENLVKDVKKFADDNNLTISRKIITYNTGIMSDYSKFYTPEFMELISEMYADDFKELGYDPSKKPE